MNPYDEEGSALRTDAYVEALLARHTGRAAPSALPPTGHSPDPAIAAAADLLASRLIRLHPSFRFEEALADRLRAAALPQTGAARADETRLADVIPWRTQSPAGRSAGAPGKDHRPDQRRLLLGGAIASGVSLAGVSLAGAVYAWRRSRPPDPLRRAVRAAHRRRPHARSKGSA